MARGSLPAFVVLILTITAIVPISAQNPQQSQPVFRSGVRLVRLDVRVLDSDGRPIPDLRPDELQVTEGDAERPVVLFQRVAGSARRTSSLRSGQSRRISPRTRGLLRVICSSSSSIRITSRRATSSRCGPRPTRSCAITCAVTTVSPCMDCRARALTMVHRGRGGRATATRNRSRRARTPGERRRLQT